MPVLMGKQSVDRNFAEELFGDRQQSDTVPGDHIGAKAVRGVEGELLGIGSADLRPEASDSTDTRPDTATAATTRGSGSW